MAVNLTESFVHDSMYFIPFFDTVICFSCPRYCSVQKNDIILEYVSQVKINVTSNWF